MQSNRLAIFEPVLILCCSLTWLYRSDLGIWSIPVCLLLFIFRLSQDQVRIRHAIHQDVLVAFFLLTAWAGFWAAYDRELAWIKVWFVGLAVLLYFSFTTQPEENLASISIMFFILGVSVSLYYFITYDFVSVPRKLEVVNIVGRWFMTFRPVTLWKPIHPNYVAGVVAITTPFIFYPVILIRGYAFRYKTVIYFFILLGLAFTGGALVMATSRGVILAILSGMVAWILWWLWSLDSIRNLINVERVFPVSLILFLVVTVVLLYVGPARWSGAIADANYYGNGTRGELASRSLYLLLAFPFTGGGLGSFPGLYSSYLLDIPFYYLPNSHNLFLDVAIEQGLLGGLAFVILYLSSIWIMAVSIMRHKGMPVYKLILLFSLTVAFIHGMVDDYLYNGIGTVLSLALVGLSINGSRIATHAKGGRVLVQIYGISVAILVVIILGNLDRVRALWYENVGAVQLEQIELTEFPKNEWADRVSDHRLDRAMNSLQTSLEFDPDLRSSNQRLGLVYMSQWDFRSAVVFLEKAHVQAPNHRGIIKSLGYCYLWLGEYDNAVALLAEIPESKSELEAYQWWWIDQGQVDFSQKATTMLEKLNSTPIQ